MKYRRKPVEINAWQWTGNNISDLIGFRQITGLTRCSMGYRRGMVGVCFVDFHGNHDVLEKGDYLIFGESLYGETGYVKMKEQTFLKEFESMEG